MESDAINSATRSQKTYPKARLDRRQGFAKILTEEKNGGEGIVEQKPSVADEPLDRVLLGTISRHNPTVSHLLVGHPEYGPRCWEIIHSDQNRFKPYTRIQTGTAVFMDPHTMNISWGQIRDKIWERDAEATDPERGKEDPLYSSSSGKTLSDNEVENKPVRETDRGNTAPVFLGTLSHYTPTVSHLLIDHPQYGRDCWDIIYARQNRNKAFTRIQVGTSVFLNPQTREIVWGEAGLDGLPATLANQAPRESGNGGIESLPAKPGFVSSKLAKAVEPYIGRSYGEMDCYELVVRGLETLGVRYLGTGGLKERLQKMAIRKGLPRNAYFNGEGLVAASGTTVYTKTFLRIEDPGSEARKVTNQLAPLLKKGLIISFSTHSKGHTGIISRKDGEWTLINSGRMDNNTEMKTDSRLVGEERLREEIKGWLKLAARSKESLKITVGRLDGEKLITFQNIHPTAPSKL